MINPGVFYLRSTPSAHSLLRQWESRQSSEAGTYDEQEALNLLKEAHPQLIEVVGAQVMNTHAAFHRRLQRTAHPAIAYDLALRLSTSYHPTVWGGPIDERLNLTRYDEMARSTRGLPLSDALKANFQEDIGGCARDQHAFICHAFARPLHMKQLLVRTVAQSRRAQLEQMLRTRNQGEQYLTLENAQPVDFRPHAKHDNSTLA